jgi:hypothetical protein
MISTKSAGYSVQPISAIVFQLDNDGDLPPVITIENLGTGASCAIIFLESDNGSTWSPIISTTNTILPGQSVATVVTSVRRLIALQASGGVPILATVQKQVNGSPTDLGTA